MNIKDYTPQQLRELADRLEDEMKLSIPKRLDNSDFSEVIDYAQAIISDIANGDYGEDIDDREYMFESVMTAIYGPDIFKWIDEQTL